MKNITIVRDCYHHQAKGCLFMAHVCMTVLMFHPRWWGARDCKFRIEILKGKPLWVRK